MVDLGKQKTELCYALEMHDWIVQQNQRLSSVHGFVYAVATENGCVMQTTTESIAARLQRHVVPPEE